jgi:hypothetical protein
MITEPLDRLAAGLSDLDSPVREPIAIRASTEVSDVPLAIGPATARVQLIGTHLRAAGSVDLGHFARLSDYVNLLDGFFTVHDVVLLSRLGAPTRITFPDFRVRLDEIAIVGQAVDDAVHDVERVIPKQRRRLVVTTDAHIIYGYAYMHEQASLTAFVDSTDPAFMPMTNVRVRWLADRRLAGRFPFALVHRRQIIGVATEVGTGLTLLTGRGVGTASEDQAVASTWPSLAADASSG